MRPMFKRLNTIFLSVCLLLVSVLHTGCSPKTTNNTLKVMDQLDIRTLDSVKAADVYSRNLITNFSEGLYTYDKHGELVLGMAACEPTRNGLTYTFKLRDSNWSDGQPVTAADFAFAWKRCVDPNVMCENMR